jgi:hypothetical protein
MTDPITTTLNATGQQFVVNQGDAPTWPRFRIDGPITNPQILNNTTGQSSRSRTRSTPASGSTSTRSRRGDPAERHDVRASALDFPNSSWWQVQAGSNDVRLLASSFSSPAQLTVFWRHAYE